MGRDVVFADQGVARFQEAVANGTDEIAINAPPDLAASFGVELLDALPASAEFIQIDATGKLTTAPASALGTLDAAYDSGGPGAGRAITADTGEVVITTPAASGNICLSLIQEDNQIAFVINKLGVGAGAAITAFDSGTGTSIQITKLNSSGLTALLSNLDGSLSWGNQLSIESSAAVITALIDHMGAGAETVLQLRSGGAGPGLHVNQAGQLTGAFIRIEADTAFDSRVEFFEDAVRRFELGYDDSAGGFVLGRLSFANSVLFIEDATGDVGINELDPDAKLHVTADVALASLIESSNATCRLGLRASGTTDENQVGVQAVADNLQLLASASPLVHLNGSDLRVGIGVTVPNAKLEVFSDVAGQATLFVNQDNATGRTLVLDSEATGQPLLELLPLTGTNTRGDIALGNRTVSASNPSEGDFWYDATDHRAEFDPGGPNANRAFLTRFGPNYGPVEDKIIITGSVTVSSGNLRIDGEGSVSDNLDNLLVTGVGPKDGDTIVVWSIGGGVTITVRSAVGNIELEGGGNRIMNTEGDRLYLLWDASSSTWREINFANMNV